MDGDHISARWRVPGALGKARGRRMRAVFDDAQTRSVARFLEAVIRDAYFMADLTAACLTASGYRPAESSLTTRTPIPDDYPAVQQWQGFLLNLAAALRIYAWEQAGLKNVLPADLPSSTEAFGSLIPAETSGSSENCQTIVTPLCQRVFRVWLERFSRASRGAIATDILLPTNTISEDAFLENLADLLWENRHLASTGVVDNGG